MIDFIKLAIKEEILKSLLSKTLLHFKCVLDTNTGEINQDILTANYGSLEIRIIYNKYVQISGSLHKHFNGTGQNGNDFYYSDLLTVLKELFEVFKINPYQVKIDNIEFGVNLINPPFDPDYLISSIVNYKGKRVSEMNVSKGYGIVCSLDHYRLKVYNKGKQYDLKEKVLRYELSYKTVTELNKIDLYNLGDLLKEEVITGLRQRLERSLNELFIFDPTIRTKDLPKKINKDLDKYESPRYYERLLKNDRKKFYNERAKVRQIFKTYLGETLQDQLKDLVLEKWDQLAELTPETLAKLILTV